MPEAALKITGLHAGYGQTVVLEAIDLVIEAGACVSILGRNGVGKTTLLESIMGHTSRHSGTIALFGAAIEREPAYRRVARGLGYVPQEREVFPSLSVVENLEVAARPGDWSLNRVFEFFPLLRQRRNNRGSQLSGGEQQMLAIGRALMGNPRVLLMDEPSEGLAPVVVEALQSGLMHLREEADLSIILVEQNSRLALSFAERCLVMNRGRIVHDGPSADLAGDESLLRRLLGVAAAG
jgi:branched-chain amino acid transport system ATP-binding protein